MQTAQPGIGLIIAKTLVPVVPMRVFGAFEAMPPGSSRVRAHPITVKIGEPLVFTAADVQTDAAQVRDVYQAISERVMAW